MARFGHWHLLAITGAGSKYTTSAPDYSQWGASDYLFTLTVLVAIVGFLYYVLSLTGRRHR